MIFKLKKELEEILKEKEDNEFEVDLIISYVTKLEKSKWILKNNISQKQIKECLKICAKRKKGVPIQYLLKNWEFFGVSIKVGKGVLIPRQDTETVVEVALKLINKPTKILDLGTGSGCIAKAIAKNKKNVTIFAVEKYKKALKYAKKNLKNVKQNIKLIKGDMLNEKLTKKFKDIDIIISNPPYLTQNEIENLQKEVSFEPKTALFGGENGLEYYEKISSIWKNSLKKGGYIIFEIGYLQKDAVEKILKKNLYKDITTYKDSNKKYRVLVGKK